MAAAGSGSAVSLPPLASGGRPRDGGAVDHGGQRSRPLDPALLPPVPGQGGPRSARGHRLQLRQSAAPTGSTRLHLELAPHESPAAAVQNGRRPHSARPILHSAGRREPLDIDSLSANSRAYRATRGAPHVIAGPTRGAAAMRSGGRSLGGAPEQGRWSVQTDDYGATDGPGAARMTSVSVPHRMNELSDGVIRPVHRHDGGSKRVHLGNPGLDE